MSMSQSLSIKNNQYLVSPSSLREAMEYSDLISKSSFCPTALKNKCGDVLIAMQMGAEVGLSPMQAIQNIAVINGKPCLFGDAALAIVQSSPHYLSHREWTDGNIETGTLIAYCAIIRKNSEEYIKSFSIENAKKALLWGKIGPWSQYPERMLQMRARSFAIRDKFADALRGINLAEEVRDYEVIEKPKNIVISMQKQPTILKKISDENNEIEINFSSVLKEIKSSQTLEKLQDVLSKFKRSDFSSRPDLFKNLIDEKDKRKSELSVKIIDEEWKEFTESKESILDSTLLEIN